MRMAARRQAMRADKGLPHRHTQFAGRDGTQHHLHGLGPELPLRQLRPVVRDVVVRTANNAKTLKTVAQAQWNHLRHQRMFLQFQHRLQRHIARRHVDVEHTRQNQLHRAALGPHHQIDALQVALKRFVELV